MGALDSIKLKEREKFYGTSSATNEEGKYIELLKPSTDNNVDGKYLEKALDIALDVRKFEIELYWKRAGYFWAFIAVCFTAYFAALSVLNKYLYVDILISCMGLVFSSIWYLVNK